MSIDSLEGYSLAQFQHQVSGNETMPPFIFRNGRRYVRGLVHDVFWVPQPFKWTNYYLVQNDTEDNVLDLLSLILEDAEHRC